MYTIKEVPGPLTMKQMRQIIELVHANAESVGKFPIQKESPFYIFASIYEQIRTDAYLRRLDESGIEKTYLIVAEDGSANIIGYLLYNTDLESRVDVAICSSIVAEEYRGQGIFSKMLNHLKSQSKSISLSCFIEKVGFYQKFGFEVDVPAGPHVGMTFGISSGSGIVFAVNDEGIDKLPVTQKILSDIKDQLGTLFERKYLRFLNDYRREEKRVLEYFETL